MHAIASLFSSFLGRETVYSFCWKGFVLSDWVAIELPVASVLNGVNVNMPGPSVRPNPHYNSAHVYFVFVTRWRR